MKPTTQELAASVCAVMLVAGVIGLALLGKGVPPEMTTLTGLVAGYLFRLRLQARLARGRTQ